MPRSRHALVSLAAAALMLFGIYGCHRGHALEGEWTLYLPLGMTSQLNFHGGKYTQVLDLGGGKERRSQGVFVLDGDQLELDEDSAGGKGGSHSTFTMEWAGDDVVYLTQSTTTQFSNSHSVLAMARNGASPDLKRLDATFSGSGGQWQVKDVRGSSVPPAADRRSGSKAGVPIPPPGQPAQDAHQTEAASSPPPDNSQPGAEQGQPPPPPPPPDPTTTTGGEPSTGGQTNGGQTNGGDTGGGPETPPPSTTGSGTGTTAGTGGESDPGR